MAGRNAEEVMRSTSDNTAAWVTHWTANCPVLQPKANLVEAKRSELPMPWFWNSRAAEARIAPCFYFCP